MSKEIPKHISLAGRLIHFLGSWEILTKDPEILSIVKWYKIPSVEEPVQNLIPHEIKAAKVQDKLVELEIQEMV